MAFSLSRKWCSVAAGFAILSVVPAAVAGDTAPAPSALESQQKAVVTYSGLRTYDDGSSTLRVDLTAQVPVDLQKKEKTMVFLLEGATVELRNNKNPLRAEYFNSNVLRTQLRDTKKGVLVEIDLRHAVTPEYKVLRHAGGAILRIDIPPGK